MINTIKPNYLSSHTITIVCVCMCVCGRNTPHQILSIQHTVIYYGHQTMNYVSKTLFILKLKVCTL